MSSQNISQDQEGIFDKLVAASAVQNKESYVEPVSLNPDQVLEVTETV